VLATGGASSCGILSDQSAVCWGSDFVGELGNGSGLTANQSAPVAVTTLSAVVAIATVKAR